MKTKKKYLFLGMIIINSRGMTVELPLAKRLKIKVMLESLLIVKTLKIAKLAECIGVLVAACPPIDYGWLYYKELKLVKKTALYLNKKDMYRHIVLSQEAVKELKWWHSNILISNNKIRTNNYDMEAHGL